ncbi:MAG: hypothetical protein LBM18_04450 [Oscillospiraceae bacterium]|jgi:ESS family glutamate:Na+ symporter|nr:hypothetical protein [Oscillospiraceae bacterium]
MYEYTSVNFFDMSVWRSILLVGVLFCSLLLANILKNFIPALKKTLIPNSVLGGIMLLIASTICYYTTGSYLFNQPALSANGSGIATLEMLTYHCLAIGFIAMTLRPVQKKLSRDRYIDILDSGVTTIGGYMIQGIFGLAITIVAAFIISDFAPGSGVLLSFGYGQGTGQALTTGKNFDLGMGLNGTYASFGLAIAALGFLTAGIVGVFYLNYLRRKGEIRVFDKEKSSALGMNEVISENETPMNESVDKMSIQVAFVFVAYLLAYGLMYLIGNVILGGGSNLIGTIYGFNFLFGVIAAVIVKGVLNFLTKKGLVRYEHKNTFLLNRISGFAFDLMIVAGICAIQVHVISNYWFLLLLLGLVGAVITFLYVRLVCKKVFPDYEHEQFLVFFGMLTGTASTGMILLREADPDFESPASENLVYQNFPAIVLGFPLLIIATRLYTNARNIPLAIALLAVIFAIFVALNLFLFRKFIFRKKTVGADNGK